MRKSSATTPTVPGCVAPPAGAAVGSGTSVEGGLVMVKRQLPRPRELFELVQFKRPSLDATRRRLESALTIEDLRAIAKRRTPAAAFDYTDGAAEAELSLARARQAFLDVEFHPSILRDVSEVDTSTTIFGDRKSTRLNSSHVATSYAVY